MKCWTLIGAAALACVGCVAQPRLVDEPVRIERDVPVATAQDAALEVILDWVIVPAGEGSWARNAQWDEYLLRVGNRADLPVTLKDVVVIDSLDGGHAPQLSQDALIRASVATRNRYRDAGVEIPAGYGAPSLTGLASGVSVAGTAAAMYGSSSGLLGLYAASQPAAVSVASAVGALAFYSLPAMLLIDASRRDSKRQVALELAKRVTPFQRTLAPGEAVALDLFFPLAPGAQALAFTYQLEDGERQLRTLRLSAPAAPVERHPAQVSVKPHPTSEAPAR